jgi:hypothetical protein
VDEDVSVNQSREDRLTGPQLLALVGRATAHVSDEPHEMGRWYSRDGSTTAKYEGKPYV